MKNYMDRFEALRTQYLNTRIDMDIYNAKYLTDGFKEAEGQKKVFTEEVSEYWRGKCMLDCWWAMTPESQSLAIDRVFYFHSRGGISISGGKPLVQADFATKLLKRVQCECIIYTLKRSLKE